MTTYVNSTIVRSIPLPHQLKRYYVHKFDVLVENNGKQFAADAYSALLEFAKFYLSRRGLAEAKLEFHKRVPFLPWNNRMKQLLRLLLSQPSYVLNFIKLYTCLEEVGPEDDFLKDYKDEMDSITFRSDLPKFMTEFIIYLNGFGDALHDDCGHQTEKSLASAKIVSGPHLRWQYHHQESQNDRLASHHDYNQWYSYWRRCWLMYRPFSRFELHRANNEKMDRIPVPELYSDAKGVQREGRRTVLDANTTAVTSKKFDEDTEAFAACLNGYMYGVSPDYVRAVAMRHMDLTDISRISFDRSQRYTAGHVEAVRKVGSTTYRAIADTNKYLNYVTMPLFTALYHRMVKCGIHDATDNQNKFDTVLTERVSNQNLYCGSVDLHHATDYLPVVWGEQLVQYMIGFSELNTHSAFQSANENTKREAILLGNSFVTFQELATTPFRSVAGEITWHRGQPLGSQPSFMMMSWTHHLFIEALAWKMGYAHHPYYILGDDIIITNKKLRKRYIQILRSCAVPLSIQKSYDGYLIEFAGKIFVKNQRPFYTTDHGTHTSWNSLFDWSRSTHIPLSWRNLPRAIKKRFSRQVYRLCTRLGVPMLASDSAFNAISAMIAEDPTYLNGVLGYITDFESYIDTNSAKKRLDHYFSGHYASGILSFRGQPITMMTSKFANKDGHWMRYNPVRLRPWFIEKFRPVTTDAYLLAGIRAMVVA